MGICSPSWRPSPLKHWVPAPRRELSGDAGFCTQLLKDWCPKSMRTTLEGATFAGNAPQSQTSVSSACCKWQGALHGTQRVSDPKGYVMCSLARVNSPRALDLVARKIVRMCVLRVNLYDRCNDACKNIVQRGGRSPHRPGPLPGGKEVGHLGARCGRQGGRAGFRHSFPLNWESPLVGPKRPG